MNTLALLRKYADSNLLLKIALATAALAILVPWVHELRKFVRNNKKS